MNAKTETIKVGVHEIDRALESQAMPICLMPTDTDNTYNIQATGTFNDKVIEILLGEFRLNPSREIFQIIVWEILEDCPDFSLRGAVYDIHFANPLNADGNVKDLVMAMAWNKLHELNKCTYLNCPFDEKREKFRALFVKPPKADHYGLWQTRQDREKSGGLKVHT